LLTARPAQPASGEFKTGVQPLPLNAKKEMLLYVPLGYSPEQPAPLAVMLHGAGGTAGHGLDIIRSRADEYGIIILAPASADYSWDIIAGENFGPDVVLIDAALDHVFTRYHIDPQRIAVGGFSDGASYALCIGLTNADLFTHVLAFSPGFYYTLEEHGAPGVFISHGTTDHVLPIGPCSRRIVPKLTSRGLHPVYREFDGEHILPPNVAGEAVKWFCL
jgi:predicted esterase